MFLVFFFFKQKTAYEMRISDWSSDVCSSDLHHPSMPYADVPAFLTRLRVTGGVWGRLALEFAVLTAARSQEVRLATWDEFDLDNALWTVSADRKSTRLNSSH